jgi:hypothetical protein
MFDLEGKECHEYIISLIVKGHPAGKLDSGALDSTCTGLLCSFRADSLAHRALPEFYAVEWPFCRYLVGLSNWAALFSDAVTGHALLLTVEIMVLNWVLQTPLNPLTF